MSGGRISETVGAGASTAPLYPFLYEQPADLAEVVAQVTTSTAEKAREIIELRRLILERERDQIVDCARRLAAAFASGGRLFTFGNGGSATDAADLAGRFLDPDDTGPALPAYSLPGDIAAVTALANDVGYELVFARQLAALGRPGDIAIGLSTSGNSANLLAAFETATRLGMVTVGFAGYSGGRMAELSSLDYRFIVPASSVHRIQEAQTTVYHVLWELTVTTLRDSYPDLDRPDRDPSSGR